MQTCVKPGFLLTWLVLGIKIAFAPTSLADCIARAKRKILQHPVRVDAVRRGARPRETSPWMQPETHEMAGLRSKPNVRLEWRGGKRFCS